MTTEKNKKELRKAFVAWKWNNGSFRPNYKKGKRFLLQN